MGVPERPPKKEGRRRLSVWHVAQIRAHYQKGGRIRELAEAFDRHPNVVANICHGRTHPRVPAAEGPRDSPDAKEAVYAVEWRCCWQAVWRRCQDSGGPSEDSE